MFRLGLLLTAAGCVFLTVTNPPKEDHKKAVYRALSQDLGAEGVLGEMAGEALGSLDVLPLDYHNYVIFSTVSLREDTVSVGLATNVWPLSRDRLPAVPRTTALRDGR